MQQPHRQNINQMNSASSAKTTSYKKGSVKINGQVSIEPNKHDQPVVPAKPARQSFGFKRDSSIQPSVNGQVNARATAGGPLVANNAETDEIEFLLEEIKDLEVPACRTDSEQDFEIAGSRVDLDLSLQLDSPIDTSWYYYSIIVFSIQMLSLFCVGLIQYIYLIIFSHTIA